jgi:glutathione S-transferase
MLELYYFPTATCGIKVRLQLEEKGIPFKAHVLDREAGDLRKPEYLKLNPKAVVPTLVHNGHVITESSIIMNYIEDVFPEPSLRPMDPLVKARIAYWLKQIDEVYFGAIGTLSYATFIRKRMMRAKTPEQIKEYFDSSPNKLAAANQRQLIDKGVEGPGVKGSVKALDKMMTDIESAVSDGRKYLLGNDYTLADAALTPFVERLERLGYTQMWAARPNAARWWETIKARPSYTKVVAGDQNEPLRKLILEAGQEAWPVVETYLAA